VVENACLVLVNFYLMLGFEITVMKAGYCVM